MSATPNKTPDKTPNKTPKRPRKPKTVDKESQGRKALAYFEEIGLREDNGELKMYYMCDICHQERNGSNISNLASHLKHCHGNIYNENIDTETEHIEIKRLKLLQNCVSIVALGGRPFAMLMDYGFQNIIAKQLNEFKMAMCRLNLKSRRQKDVHEYLHDAANSVRKEISDAIKNRDISIQMDIGSRLGRSLFGIDVQYAANSGIVIHNIGMIVLNKSHSGENLSAYYRSCLRRYNIKKKQILSVTGDNAKNVQKLIRIESVYESSDDEKTPPKKKVSKRLVFEVSDLYEEAQPDDQINAAIETILQTDELTDESALEMIFEDCDISLNDFQPSSYDAHHDQLLETVLSEAAIDYGYETCFNLNGIKCAEHTLQLGVKDSLKALSGEMKNVIKLTRRVAKILRLDSTKQIVNQLGLNLKKPKLDVETRWGSTYIMVRVFKWHRIIIAYLVSFFLVLLRIPLQYSST